MEICRAMHVHSPVEKRHHTKNSYRNSTVFKVVCGDTSKLKLVLGTLIQGFKRFNFRLHLQSLNYSMEICRAMHVHSPVEKRHNTKNSYRNSTVFKVVRGDISKSKLVLGTLIQGFEISNFRLHLQSLSHPMEICIAMHVHSPVERRHHTKKLIQVLNRFQGCPRRH